MLGAYITLPYVKQNGLPIPPQVREANRFQIHLVSESIDWPNLELDSLIQVLASSDLVTLQEVQVFRSVERWLGARRQEMMERG